MTTNGSEPNVTIELDRVRRLFVDWNVIGDLEEQFDLDVSLASLLEQGKIGHGILRVFMWRMLQVEDPKLTKEQTGKLLHEFVRKGGTFQQLTRVLVQALREYEVFGKVKEDEATDTKADAGAEKPSETVPAAG